MQLSKIFIALGFFALTTTYPLKAKDFTVILLGKSSYVAFKRDLFISNVNCIDLVAEPKYDFNLDNFIIEALMFVNYIKYKVNS